MKNLFGTDGIRATVGKEPLTLSHLSQCGAAIARWALDKYGTRPHILLSHDTRQSAYWIMSALQAGLLLNPITIHYAHVFPTAGLCKLLQQNNSFHAGIVISASHNGFHDNGIKIIDRITGKLSQEEEMNISSYYHTPQPFEYTHFGTVVSYDNSFMEYAEHIVATFEKKILSHLTIVLDCAHGATYKVAPYIFNQLGAQVIPINVSPNGLNINKDCGSLSLKSLQHAVVHHKADIGFAFDGDGDRVIAVNRSGEIKNGDDILALLSTHPLYEQEKTIIGTVMTNHGLDLFLRPQNKNLVRTAVGDKYVAEYLERDGGLLGGEQSGHIILHDYLQTGDGIMTALRILESILHTGNWQMDTFKKCPQLLINLPIEEKKDLNDPTIAALISEYESQLNSGRLVIRYSGTENVLRIMIEDKEENHMRMIGTHLASALKKEL